MNASKLVEVLCPNGRRQKVKVDPSMTVLQVLQGVCAKQGYNEAEYDLKHFQTVLNVTSLMRFLNLTNNAKLEMIKCVKVRAASTVTVALQLEDGSRLQDQFDPTTSLMGILQHFQKERTDVVKPETVCIYMRNEYKSTDTLESTTLKAMGITSGRAVIRLALREVDENITSAPCKSEENTKSSLKEINEIVEPNEKKLKLEPSSKKEHPTEQSHNTEYSSPATLHQQVLGPPPRSIFADHEHVSNVRDIFPSHDFTPTERNVVASAFAPCEFADFKFPDNIASSIKDEDEDTVIDPKLLRTEVKLAMPCERQAIIYSMKSSDSTVMIEELDDSFFEVTIDDLRKRLTNLKSETKDKEEALLLTKNSRQRIEIEKLSNFPKIPIRFQFPDKIILQGFFRPLETVTTPPKLILKNYEQSLYKAKLFPAALIHISTKTQFGSYLKPEYLENLKTYDEAETLLRKNIDRMETTVEKDSKVSAKSTTTTSSDKTKPKTKGAPRWFKTGR